MENIETEFDLPNKTVRQQSHRKVKQKRPPTLVDNLTWAVDGVAFPHGTKLRGKYKGYVYQGNVNNGAFILNGQQFLSPCAATITITRKPVDGWLFWDCQLPDQSDWVSIYELKNA